MLPSETSVTFKLRQILGHVLLGQSFDQGAGEVVTVG
jgi:hypothetical protein